MRLFGMLVISTMLAACGNGQAGGETPTQDVAGGGSPGFTDCSRAFESVEFEEPIANLSNEIEALDGTITACQDLDEWLGEAERTIGQDVDLTEAEEFVIDRCRMNPELLNTAICNEIGVLESPAS